MKNIQIIDGAANATFSLFQATEEEFDAIFPDERDIELIEDLIDRLGEEAAGAVLAPLWDRPILKRDALGIHGTLFYVMSIGGITSRRQNVKSIGKAGPSTKPSETCSPSTANLPTPPNVIAAANRSCPWALVAH